MFQPLISVRPSVRCRLQELPRLGAEPDVSEPSKGGARTQNTHALRLRPDGQALALGRRGQQRIPEACISVSVCRKEKSVFVLLSSPRSFTSSETSALVVKKRRRLTQSSAEDPREAELWRRLRLPAGQRLSADAQFNHAGRLQKKKKKLT